MLDNPKTYNYKDEVYLHDMIRLNNSLLKKLHLYSSLVEDEQVEKVFKKAKKMHVNNTSTLLNMLDDGDY
ncbi:MAG: hypothetical protein IJ572_01840 [Bacilli bacterium]|nr:hypothetical protein [Bacilli bacterium]